MTRLEAAAAAYRAAVIARRDLDHARDQLVTAALEHTRRP